MLQPECVECLEECDAVPGTRELDTEKDIWLALLVRTETDNSGGWGSVGVSGKIPMRLGKLISVGRINASFI